MTLTSSEPVWSTEHAKIYQGDARIVLRQFDPESVEDMVMTSPPYWGLRDYSTEPVLWDQDPDCKHEFQTRNYLQHSGRSDAPKSAKYSEQAAIPDKEMSDELCAKCGRAWRGQFGQEPNIDMYLDHLMEIFDEIWRVLRPDGTLWVNLGDTYTAVPAATTPTAHTQKKARAARGCKAITLLPGSKSAPVLVLVSLTRLEYMASRFA